MYFFISSGISRVLFWNLPYVLHLLALLVPSVLKRPVIFGSVFPWHHPHLVRCLPDVADGDWAGVTDSPGDRQGFSGPGWMCPGTRLINHPFRQTTTEKRHSKPLARACACQWVLEKRKERRRVGRRSAVRFSFYTENRCHRDNSLFI